MKKHIFFYLTLLTGIFASSLCIAGSLPIMVECIKAKIAALDAEVLSLADQQGYHTACANFLNSSALSLEHAGTEFSALSREGDSNSYYLKRTMSNLQGAQRKFLSALEASDCTTRENFQVIARKLEAIIFGLAAIASPVKNPVYDKK